jgi:hypothetical protein
VYAPKDQTTDSQPTIPQDTPRPLFKSIFGFRFCFLFVFSFVFVFSVVSDTGVLEFWSHLVQTTDSQPTIPQDTPRPLLISFLNCDFVLLFVFPLVFVFCIIRDTCPLVFWCHLVQTMDSSKHKHAYVCV